MIQIFLHLFDSILIYMESVMNGFNWIQGRRMGALVIRVGWRSRVVFRDGREIRMIAWNGPGSRFPWKDFKSRTFSLSCRLIIIFTIKCLFVIFLSIFEAFFAVAYYSHVFFFHFFSHRAIIMYGWKTEVPPFFSRALLKGLLVTSSL